MNHQKITEYAKKQLVWFVHGEKWTETIPKVAQTFSLLGQRLNGRCLKCASPKSQRAPEELFISTKRMLVKEQKLPKVTRHKFWSRKVL